MDGWDRFAKLVSFMGGAAAFMFIQQSAPASGAGSALNFAAISAVVISFTSGLSLVYQFSTKARKHAELSRDFKKLLGAIERHDPDALNAAVLGEWRFQISALEASEPARLGALTTHCHNELVVARGNKELVTRLSWIQGLLMNYLDFDQSKLAD